jgi:hypothetical protein
VGYLSRYTFEVKNALTQRSKMRFIQITFCLLVTLGIFVGLVQAEPRVIPLGILSESPLKAYQNVPIKLSNTFQTNLYNLTVTKPPLSKEIISVSEFNSGQSFDLSFSKSGIYEICFSKEKNKVRTCLSLDVLKRIVT